MGEFFQVAFSFPTILYSFLLCLSIIFWFIAALGLLDIDVLDVDVDLDLPDMDAGLDLPTDAMADSTNATPDATGLAGLLLKLGLDGVPITVVLTLLSLFGWMVSYFIEILLVQYLPLGILRYPLGIVLFFLALIPAVFATGVACRPLRPFFRHRLEMPSLKRVLGQTAVVRSGKVTPTFGEAVLDDNGAGLILKVRAAEERGFKKGDRVVLLEYLPAEGAYRVITEDEFKGL